MLGCAERSSSKYRGFKRLFKSFLQNSNSTFIKSCRYAKESPRLLPCAPLRGGWKQPILCAVGRGRCDCESIAKRVGSEPNASRYDKGENYEQCLVTSRLRLHNSTVGISCQGVFVKNFKKISKPRKKVHKSGNQNIKESLKMSILQCFTGRVKAFRVATKSEKVGENRAKLRRNGGKIEFSVQKTKKQGG